MSITSPLRKGGTCTLGRGYFGENQAALQTHRFDSQALLRLSNEALIAKGLIVGGDPNSVWHGLERWQSLGVDLMLGAGRTTHDQVMHALDLLGEKVLPKFPEPVAAHAPAGATAVHYA